MHRLATFQLNEIDDNCKILKPCDLINPFPIDLNEKYDIEKQDLLLVTPKYFLGLF